MSEMSVDPHTLHAWLSARSLARGLPAPVPDHGGFRVDTRSETETTRWVFPCVTAGLAELGRTIAAPGHLLKLCGTAADLRAALPDSWQLHPPACFMSIAPSAAAGRAGRSLPAGYDLEVNHDGAVATVRINTRQGELAASGHAAEIRDAFIYDRIVTEPAHRRRGLGRIVMAALRDTKQDEGSPELLVATRDGHALYTALGWHVISPYITASIKGT